MAFLKREKNQSSAGAVHVQTASNYTVLKNTRAYFKQGRKRILIYKGVAHFPLRVDQILLTKNRLGISRERKKCCQWLQPFNKTI